MSANIVNPIIESSGLSGLSGGEFISGLLGALIGLALLAGAVIFFFMLLAGGLQWITSGGDKGAVESARGRITNALIGIVILFSIFAILTIVESFFHISFRTFDIGPLSVIGHPPPSDGTCTGANFEMCSGTCVNVAWSNAHCGGCNQPCPPGLDCTNRVCL